MRGLWLIAGGLALLLALLAGAGVLYVRSALPERAGVVEVPGLGARVRILEDARGVPHIRAGSLEDALFAQGYLHARDRLWQMELVRRAVQGRLSEVLGEGALETDRFMRRLGLWRATADAMRQISAEERRLMDAYAAGAGAALETWSGALPPEFLALRYRPEPWTSRDILAVGKMMSFTLSSYSEAAAVARAVSRLGPERARHLFPEYPEWGTTILEARPPAETPAGAAALIDGFSMAAASNSWVVGGSRTRSGKPILANDPHLGLQAPSLWYLVGIRAPGADGVDVVGASIPGAPLVILGRNRAIAWGMTNAYVDDADIFVERLDPDDPERYLAPGGPRRFEVVAESIAVRGRERPEVLIVRRTRHGPVLPADGPSGSTVLAVQWTALEPVPVFRGILELNRASDWITFLSAADALEDPHQNLVYADTAGHIGYVMGGTVPLRGERRSAPVAPVPGWTGEWDWRGALPFEEHPRALDPPRGFIVTANNRQTVEPIAELISGSWQEPFRALRITEMLTAGDALDVEAMRTMQMDVLDIFARRYRDRAVEAARLAGLEAEVARLHRWDLRASPDSRAATLFYLWTETVRRAAARDLYGGEPGFFPRNSLVEVLERRSLPWREDGPEAYRQIAVRAMEESAGPAADRPWREGNRALHEHALGAAGMLDRLLGLNLGPWPHQGSPTTVNVAHYAFRVPASDFPFTTTAGASLRHVADLGSPAGASGFVIGTGQSGVPFSRHYDDFAGPWSRGELWPLRLDSAAVERAAEHTLILEPDRRK